MRVPYIPLKLSRQSPSKTIAMRFLHSVCFDRHYLNVKIVTGRLSEHLEILSTLRCHYYPNLRFVLKYHSFQDASQILRSPLHLMPLSLPPFVAYGFGLEKEGP